MAVVAFITITDLLERFGATELAQLCSARVGGNISATELRTKLEDGDITGWANALKTTATRAENILQLACDRANSDLTAAVRSGSVLPDSTTPVSIPEDAKHNALNIARYQLYGDAYPEHIRKAYEDTQDWLKQLRRGQVVLDFGLSTGANGGGLMITPVRYTIFDDDQDYVIFR